MVLGQAVCQDKLLTAKAQQSKIKDHERFQPFALVSSQFHSLVILATNGKCFYVEQWQSLGWLSTGKESQIPGRHINIILPPAVAKKSQSACDYYIFNVITDR